VERPRIGTILESGTGANRQPDVSIVLMLAAATLTSPGFDIYFLQFMSSLNAKEFGFGNFIGFELYWRLFRGEARPAVRLEYRRQSY